ncbi:hypothetical protein MTE1_4658 [Klebsiella pneumoniae JHCK1]|nr:hypothetical protein MTE1_4658 [Klebsiella pneumoniae JHCK1]
MEPAETNRCLQFAYRENRHRACRHRHESSTFCCPYQSLHEEKKLSWIISLFAVGVKILYNDVTASPDCVLR